MVFNSFKYDLTPGVHLAAQPDATSLPQAGREADIQVVRSISKRKECAFGEDQTPDLRLQTTTSYHWAIS
jgi:hypothetical protein